MQNKKHFSVLSITFYLLLMIAFAFAPLSVYAEEAPFEGSGTESDPYLIANYEDLCKLAELTNQESEPYLSAYYLQTADIVANSGTFSLNENNEPLWNGKPIAETNTPIEWCSISNDLPVFGDAEEIAYAFSGTYNGNGYYISGLYLSGDGKSSSVFQNIYNAKLINITIKNSLFCGESGFSGLCDNTKESVIENCKVQTNIIGKHSVAGITGGAEYSTIIDCTNTGTLICKNATLVAGISATTLETDVISCINEGDIISLGNEEDYTAGIIAQASEGTINFCFNSGDIKGNYYTAGIAASAFCDIVQCLNEGNIIGKETVAGICAEMNGDGNASPSEIYNCTNNGNIETEFKEKTTDNRDFGIGGIVGIADFCNITFAYNTGNITTTSQHITAGGICGTFKGGSTEKPVFLIYSANSGKVNGIYIVGGICGSMINNNPIYFCYNTAQVSGKTNVGGILGMANVWERMIYITGCYNIGTVSGNSVVGSIAGKIHADIIDHCFYLQGTSKNGIGQNTLNWGGAEPRTETQMKKEDFVSELNAIEIAYRYDDLNENNGYPELLGWSKMPFLDVLKDAYYFDNVVWAVQNGITYGVDNIHFGPDQNCTRAQFITFLWRAAGEPEATITQTPFTDCDVNQYYYPALLWAYENDLVAGMTETTFEPNGKITRAQVVTFLWRDAGSEIIKTTSPFTDVPSDAWYADAVTWAYSTKLASGMTETTFGPDIFSTRAHVVAFLHRYAEAEIK